MHVGDVDEGLAFYRDLVGFELMTHFDSAAFVSAGGYHHHLGFNVWRGEGVPPVPADAVGLRHWTVLIDEDSLSELRERLEAGGGAAGGAGRRLHRDRPLGDEDVVHSR